MRTRVGYAGGRKDDPTYLDLGDHTESIEIDFDPAVVTYRQLLDVFFAAHRPVRQPWSRQYRSAIFFHGDEQLRHAEEARRAAAKRYGETIYTAIEAAGRFYRAEDYHQKYRLRNVSVVARELLEIYPDTRDFVDSTAVTRVNGYLAGFGSQESLEQDLPRLGLSDTVGAILLRRVLAKPAVQCGD